MATSSPGDATRILSDIRAGNGEARSELFMLVYDELREKARSLWSEPSDHTWQPTVAVHEAYLALLGRTWPAGVTNSRQFMGMACRVLHCILIDHARKRRSQKKGGNLNTKLPLDDVLDAFEQRVRTDPSALDEVLGRLENADPRRYAVVEMRFFGGLTVEQVAAALDISKSTVEREWRLARAWIRRELCESDTGG